MYTLPPIAYLYRDIVPWLAVANIVIAVSFLIVPGLFAKANEILTKWISTHKLEEALNKNRDIDSHILQARKIVGYTSAILAVLLIILYWKM